jgi:hypothetical protein
MKDAIIALGWVTAKDYARAERMKGCDAERCADIPFLCAWCLVRENEAEYRSILLHTPAIREEGYAD